MRELTFSFFKNAYWVEPAVVTRTWAQWCELFGVHEIRGKASDTANEEALDRNKNGPCLVFGKVETHRKKENVKFIDALSIDLEHKTDERLSIILKKLEVFEFALWSTHRSQAAVVSGETRLRVVLPLARRLEPSEFWAAWDALQTFLEGANDKSTRDIVRLHFLPSTFNRDYAVTYQNHGVWLEPFSLPGATPPKKNEDARKEENRTSRSLEFMIDKITRRRSDHVLFPERKEIIRALVSGKALGDPGERHAAILSATYWIARVMPDLYREEIELLLARSVAAMNAQGDRQITASEIWDAYSGALIKIAEDKKKEKKEKTKKEIPEPAGQNPYRYEELVTIAGRQKCTVEELERRWVISISDTTYILQRDGRYSKGWGRWDAPHAVRIALKDAPVPLWLPTANGGWKKKTLPDIIDDNGSLATQVIADLTVQWSYFDAGTGIFHEAVRPLRGDLEARFDPIIDQWLKKFGGERYEQLLDWLACASDLKKSLCALYFDGPKESGKSMFAVGLAKLWTEGGPAEAEQVLGNFNDDLARCPLVFVDEKMPKNYTTQSASAKLRAMLGTAQRTLKRKYMPNADLVGNLRLVLAANNESLLDELEAATKNDMEAIAQRFLYVDVREAVAFLETVPKEVTEHWWDRGLAEHALWLARNHEIKSKGKRFVVEGSIAEIHRLLLTGGHWTSLVCEWLTRYLMNPKKIHQDTEYTGLIRIQGGELLVNEQCIADNWSMYLPNTHQDPIIRKIGEALRAISQDERKQLRWNRRQIRYRVIIEDHLVAWSDRYGIADEQLIRDRISGVMPLDAVASARSGDENGREDANDGVFPY